MGPSPTIRTIEKSTINTKHYVSVILKKGSPLFYESIQVLGTTTATQTSCQIA